jgi:steroid delta-isomerase-like uncharacterized protein
MSTAHQALAHRFAEILNGHDAGRFADLIAPNYVNHNPYVEQGQAGVIAFFSHWLEAFPDTHVTLEDVIATDDKVVGRYTYRGTHSGNFMGYPPTGTPVCMRSIDIWRVKDGRFVEHWDELNTLEVFQQIGAAKIIPPVSAASS